jgi:hypothetical protein
MSDNYLRLIPIAPDYVPSSEQIDQALEALAGISGAIVSRFAVLPEVQFVDPGSNLESVVCPRCGAQQNLEWWTAAMDRASQTGFRDLHLEMPCCGQSVSLNDLAYTWPAGFTRFLIEYRNPGADIGEDALTKASAALGVGLRRIWAHY